MTHCSMTICGELLQIILRKNVRTAFFFLTCMIGLFYLWNLRYIAAAVTICFILLLEFFESAQWFPDAQDEPKETEAVLVTGCDTGLGYSLALHLHSIGFYVIAGVYNKDGPGALKLAKKKQIFVHHLDITSCESVRNFSDAVRDFLQQKNLGLRAFVNNAGAMIFGEFEWQTEDQMRHQVEVNLLGTMRVTREFLPIIRAHQTRLIVITSHCALEPLPGVAAYGASKAGLSAWTTALRVELKKFNVKVVNFVPGSFVGESNLLAQQRKYFDAMKSEMSSETWSFYDDYFTRYANYILSIAPSNLPQKLTNPSIYKIFDNALLDRSPRAFYKCEPWRYKVYHSLFKILPTTLRDRLVLAFVQLPAWNDTKYIRNAEEDALSSLN